MKTEEKIKYKIYLINFLLATSGVIGMTIIPFIIVENLGFSFFILGLVEGGSELASQILRLYSGLLFDRKDNKLKLFLTPITLALFSKLILIIPNDTSVMATKFLERISNGYFGTLRDSLILRFYNKEGGGKNLSLLNISKSAGCLLAPLIVVLFSYLFSENYIQKCIYFCVCACTLALMVGYVLLKYTNSIPPNNNTDNSAADVSFSFKFFKKLEPIYPILLISFIYYLARWNDGMLILYFKGFDGCPEWVYLSTIGIFNAFMLILSPYIGNLLDTGKAKTALMITISSMLCFSIICYFMTEYNIFLIFLALFFWGAQRLTSQMVFIYLIKQNVKEEYLGQAIGTYSVLIGIAVLAAASTAGWLAKISLSYIFLYSFIVTIAAVIVIFFITNNAKIKF